MAIKITRPDEFVIHAVRTFLLNKPGPDCVNLSALFGEKGEICLSPAQARRFSSTCRKLAEEINNLADQAEGIKFPHK